MKILSVTAEESPKGREQARKGGDKVDKEDCAGVFSMIDRLIDISEPERAEYLRGYQRGMRVSVQGVILDERADEHKTLIDHSDGGSGDLYIDSFARGYRDGFEGKQPESHSVSSKSSKPSLIASII
jgi:hypothetical protein